MSSQSTTVTDPTPIPRAGEILTPEALAFITELNRRFNPVREELLAARGAKREAVASTSCRKPSPFVKATGRLPRPLPPCRTAALK